MESTIKVEYRDIAKMLVKAMPIQGDDFGAKVSEYLDTIKAMPKAAKVALKCAYVFASKVPREEREDMFQELALNILKARVGEEKLAYAIARCDWLDWWKAYKIRQHTSLDSVVEDTEGNSTTLGELIVGEAEFEAKVCDEIDCGRIWSILNQYPHIKAVVVKRLTGQPLRRGERQYLDAWVGRIGASLIMESA